MVGFPQLSQFSSHWKRSAFLPDLNVWWIFSSKSWAHLMTFKKWNISSMAYLLSSLSYLELVDTQKLVKTVFLKRVVYWKMGVIF
jgi:hypothetical protein